MNKYDSKDDTLLHIGQVQKEILCFVQALTERAINHDQSKLKDPEKSVFDRVTVRLRSLTYGSEEYTTSLQDLGDALTHHYAVNRHHPEHFENGINGMTLVDLVEMYCDWAAACRRHADGNIYKSLEVNRLRFGIDDQLHQILLNTIKMYE